MAYVYPDYPTKVSVRRALKAGEKIICRENTPGGHPLIMNGVATVEGPHYPKPHRWYGQVKVVDGYVTSIR